MIDRGPDRGVEYRVVRATAAAYLANAAVGAWLSIREDLPGEPLGLGTRLGVRRDLASGAGAALSAPAPMLVALGWLAGRRIGRGDDSRALAALTALGAAFCIGMAAEPVAHEVVADPRARPARTAIVAGNLVIPAVMGIAGLRALGAAARRAPTG